MELGRRPWRGTGGGAGVLARWGQGAGGLVALGGGVGCGEATPGWAGVEAERRGFDGEFGRTAAMAPAGAPGRRGKLGSGFFGR